MAISAQRGEPFLFYITPPVVFRVLGLVYAGLVLLGTAYVGLPTLSRRLNHPAPWLLDIMLAGWVLFWVLLPLRLVFPSLASQARLEIRHDGLRFVPRRVIRYFGEVVDKVAVNPESTEILLCQSFYLDIPDGYRMVVRGAHEPDREIDVKFFKTPDAQDCPTIIEGVTKATGLPVRLVIRRRLADGTVQEMPWIPITRKARTARDFAVTTMAAVPLRWRNHRWMPSATPDNNRDGGSGSLAWTIACQVCLGAVASHNGERQHGQSQQLAEIR
jgi:hypothetical protein